MTSYLPILLQKDRTVDLLYTALTPLSLLSPPHLIYLPSLTPVIFNSPYTLRCRRISVHPTDVLLIMHDYIPHPFTSKFDETTLSISQRHLSLLRKQIYYSFSSSYDTISLGLSTIVLYYSVLFFFSFFFFALTLFQTYTRSYVFLSLALAYIQQIPIHSIQYNGRRKRLDVLIARTPELVRWWAIVPSNQSNPLSILIPVTGLIPLQIRTYMNEYCMYHTHGHGSKSVIQKNEKKTYMHTCVERTCTRMPTHSV